MNEIVKSLDGTAFTESQIVGPKFKKEHKHVLESIDRIVQELTAENAAVKDYFVKSTFTNNRNREYRNYLMTRDGFSLLAMSFTGSKAIQFKVKFIHAFNSMEKRLKDQSFVRQVGVETRKVLTDEIKDSGENDRMKGHGFSTYTKLAYKLAGIKYVKPPKGEVFRDNLNKDDLLRVENIESMMKSLIKTGKQYGDIKEDLNNIFGSVKLEGK
jgi:Rha family phage regulatory protein